MIFALILWACDEPDCTPRLWYVDSDGDGFHAGILPIEACDEPEDGYVLASGDCDDGDISASPDNTEQCDGVDNNCDGDVDEGVTATFYADEDGDGFGDPDTASEGCAAPGTTADATDTDDTDPNTYPGADEICDGVDNDGNGEIDEDPTDAPTWYLDADKDGFGGTPLDTVACDAPAGTFGSGDDCDDGSALVFPGATELCDNRVNDCDTAWTESTEAGIASFAGKTGAWTDATAYLAGSTAAEHEISTPGTLWLCEGAYVGSIALLADVDVRGRGAVTLDASEVGPVLWVGPEAHVAVEGIRLTNGRADSGGGLWVSPGAVVSVSDAVIEGNAATSHGGGIYVDGGTLSLLRAEIVDNAAPFGGGIALASDSVLTAEGSAISNNTAAQDGGGVYANGGSKLSIAEVELDNTQLEDNTAGKHGGAMHVVYTNAALEATTASRNEATAAGGGLSVSFSSVTLTDTALTENDAPWLGAALYLNDNAQVACASAAGSTSASTHGAYNNTGTYAVHINDREDYDDDNTLQSSGCDWGTAGDDNAYGDIYLNAVYTYTLDEDFTCATGTGCR